MARGIFCYKRCVKTHLALTCSLAAMLSAGVAHAAPLAPKQLTSVEGITEYVLGNGMHVLLFPDTSKDTFTVNVTYLVGSRMEGYGETGMAHLLEHMMFKGSPKHPKVWEELKARGASNNASTWYDRTNYFETLPVKADNLVWALEMEADRMLNSNIAQADLNKEFSVVRNEFEIGENKPDEVLSERIWSTAYLWHNYGKSTIGSRADIEKVPATSLKRFYKKYYRPDNAVILLAGKFDPTLALAQINTAFGTAANPATPIEPTYTTEPVQDGEREVTLRRNGDVQILGLLYHTSAAGDADFSATEAIGELLTDEPSGRLYIALVKSGLATSVSASLLPLHDPGALEISVTVAAGKPIGPVRDKLLAIVEGFAKSKIGDDEIARVKAKAKKRFKLQLANSASLGIAISEFIAAGDWRLLFLNRDRVAALTTADVQKAAAAYLIASNRTLGTFIPAKTVERAPQRETPDVGKIVASYKGQPAEAEGEKFDASLDNIDKRTVRDTFPNGMKLAVLQKGTRGHVVRARLTLRYGAEADFTGSHAPIAMLGTMLSRGTTKHTFQQLKDQWDLLEAQVGFTAGPGTIDVDIQTTKDNLAPVLALVDEVLRTPTLPQEQFAIAVKEELTGLEDQKSDPQTQAFLAMTRAVSPYPKTHPLYTQTTDEEIAELKALHAGDLRKYVTLFGASNATMSIVGDVDAKAIAPWVEKTWGGWKSPKAWKRIARKFTAPAASVATLDFADKANALIVAGHAVDIKDDDVDAPAMMVSNYVLGGGGFVSRLLTRLRQQEGLSYFAFSAFQMSPLDPSGVFFAGGAMNPSNAKKGMAAMLQEIDKLIASGVAAQELGDAKKGMQSDFDRNLTNDAVVVGILQDSQYLDRKLEFWKKRWAAIQALTPDAVNAAIKKHLHANTLVKVTAGDVKKM